MSSERPDALSLPVAEEHAAAHESPLETQATCPEEAPLSKNALKRARKAAFLQEKKLERRAREKAARKEKKRNIAEKVAAGEIASDDERVRKKAKSDGGPKTPFNARVVVDLGFDDKMSDKEVKSLVLQLAYTYSANRRSSAPFTSLLFTSLGGKTKERLDGMNEQGYRRWVSTEWWEANLEDLWSGMEEGHNGTASKSPATGSAENANSEHAASSSQAHASASKTSVVYLTADSPDVLQELSEGQTYVIGGVCDHNRYKNLCLEKAQQLGVRAAQLPIGVYLSNMPTRKVLTVNQVFEILVKWTETRSWEEAFYSVIPKRKFQSKDAPDSNGGDINVDDPITSADANG